MRVAKLAQKFFILVEATLYVARLNFLYKHGGADTMPGPRDMFGVDALVRKAFQYGAIPGSCLGA